MKKILVMVLVGLSVCAGGLFDGNTFSNGGEAFQYLSNKIRANHSSSGKGVDLSALENMTTEQWEKRTMFEMNSERFREIDLRGETIEEYQVFSIELESANISIERREEINEYLEEKLETLERRVELSLFHQPVVRTESCLQLCHHNSNVGDLACFREEIIKRETCSEMSILNPMKIKCHYDANSQLEKCNDDDGWAFQQCQAKCFR